MGFGREGPRSASVASVAASRLPRLTMEEVSKHNRLGRSPEASDMWLVNNNKVYDITKWAFQHPGGVRVITSWAGQDASTVIESFHIDRNMLSKSMKGLCVGQLVDASPSVDEDFLALHRKYTKQGLFKPNPLFYAAHFLHIIGFYALAYLCASHFGIGWLPTLTTALLITCGQAQAGWLQHDFGHLSVFPNSQLNHLAHQVVIGTLKGASSSWWNHRHFRHHSKPNVVSHDPDIDIAYLFMLGDKIPKWWAEKKKGFMPYDWQHRYWFIIGPPLLLPTYFHYDNIKWVFGRKKWVDLLFIAGFFTWFFYLFTPIYGGWGTFGLYMLSRTIESQWFTWVTQMNHIPMSPSIDRDQRHPWVAQQSLATCNVEHSWFNDWFTGHLNFQVEHHLFPTMPRHNYVVVADEVKALCAKHGVPYETKTLYGAFAAIVESLQNSGQLWKDTYQEVHGKHA